MKVTEKGHMYELDDFDNFDDKYLPPTLFFMKRVGPHYPGNKGEPHHGTNCQEVLRVLIDRVKYLDEQIPCQENGIILRYLRYCLLNFEMRAARMHGRTLKYQPSFVDNDIENEPTCKTCGHMECQIKEHENGFQRVPETS